MQPCLHCTKNREVNSYGLCRRCRGSRIIVAKYRAQPTRCKGICSHCTHTRTLYGRRLCYACYYDPAIRQQYPCLDDGLSTRSEPPEPSMPALYPTIAQPGSPEKVAIMAYRFASGQALHHPDDPKHAKCVAGDDEP